MVFPLGPGDEEAWQTANTSSLATSDRHPRKLLRQTQPKHPNHTRIPLHPYSLPLSLYIALTLTHPFPTSPSHILLPLLPTIENEKWLVVLLLKISLTEASLSRS